MSSLVSLVLIKAKILMFKQMNRAKLSDFIAKQEYIYFFVGSICVQ